MPLKFSTLWLAGVVAGVGIIPKGLEKVVVVLVDSALLRAFRLLRVLHTQSLLVQGEVAELELITVRLESILYFQQSPQLGVVMVGPTQMLAVLVGLEAAGLIPAAEARELLGKEVMAVVETLLEMLAAEVEAALEELALVQQQMGVLEVLVRHLCLSGPL